MRKIRNYNGNSNEENEDKYIIEYEYLTIKDHTTSLINQETLIRNNKVETITRYEYDDKLNLRNVIENTELMTRYSYDNLNRLVREDNGNKLIYRFYNIKIK